MTAHSCEARHELAWHNASGALLAGWPLSIGRWVAQAKAKHRTIDANARRKGEQSILRPDTNRHGLSARKHARL